MLAVCPLFDCCEDVFPFTYENNPLNGWNTTDINPSSYNNNVVIITMNILRDYNPQDNTQAGTNIPKNMVFTIHGKAMEIPANPVIDTSFNVTLSEFTSGMTMLNV